MTCEESTHRVLLTSCLCIYEGHLGQDGLHGEVYLAHYSRPEKSSS